MAYYVYILVCKDGYLYTGITGHTQKKPKGARTWRRKPSYQKQKAREISLLGEVSNQETGSNTRKGDQRMETRKKGKFN